MSIAANRGIARSLVRLGAMCLLAAGLCWHLRSNVQPELVYYADGLVLPDRTAVGIPLFLRGSEFRAAFLRRPGGSVEYCAAALAQLCYYPWAGAAMLTGCAVVLYAATVLLLGRVGFRDGWLWAFAQPLLLLWNYNRYVLAVDLSLALAASLLLGWAYLMLATIVSRLVAAVALPSAITLAYLLGGPPAMVMAGVCVLWEVVAGRRYVVAVAGLAAALAVPAICGWWLQLVPTWDYRVHKAIYPWLPATDAGQLLLFIVLLAMVAARCCCVLVERWRPSAVKRVAGAVKRIAEGWGGIVALGTAMLVSAAVAIGTLDRQSRWTLQINWLARTERWSELIEHLEGYPSERYTQAMLCDVCRALYETGQLGSALFRYPQQPGALFQRGQQGAFVRGSAEVLFLLGSVNEAEHVAHESLEVHGERPDILRLLARVHLAKGNPAAARVFLHILCSDLIHGRWAKQYLERLERNPVDADDGVVRAAKANMGAIDLLAEQATEEDILVGLLERNPANRMAAEYLMAWCLLTRQPEKLAKHFQRFEQLRPAGQVGELPRLWAEALAWSRYRAARGRPPAPAVQLDPTVLQQVAEVVELIRRYREDRQALEAELTRRFPDSFSRYLITGRSGLQP